VVSRRGRVWFSSAALVDGESFKQRFTATISEEGNRIEGPPTSAPAVAVDPTAVLEPHVLCRAEASIP
jgi:hypothetical protein